MSNHFHYYQTIYCHNTLNNFEADTTDINSTYSRDHRQQIKEERNISIILSLITETETNISTNNTSDKTIFTWKEYYIKFSKEAKLICLLQKMIESNTCCPFLQGLFAQHPICIECIRVPILFCRICLIPMATKH